MCRWLAYAGPAIYLEDLLFEQEYSLVQQSLSARESVLTTNGDGFGVAWYGSRRNPGLFKDILPAWNDSNLRSIASQVESRLFFAHVRSSTGTAVSRSNCHPFSFQNWVFMHNGKIGGWSTCRRDIEALIHRDFYQHRAGTTDSEALFLIALSEGLVDAPEQAMSTSLRKVQDIMTHHKIEEPLRISAACSDGNQIWGFRYSSDQESPSLYYGTPNTHAKDHFEGQINTLASEPSDNDATHWTRVEESSGVHWSGGKVRIFPLEI
jgi:glutamine amidotransferase